MNVHILWIMETPEISVVTGAFGYTGKYIAKRLLQIGRRVRTLTGHPDRPNPFGGRVDVALLNFDNPRELVKSLQGATTLYNTYWIRFPYRRLTFRRAIENTKTLVKAAEEAGVRRIVHISITNACEESSFPYFRGKGIVERAIMQSRVSYAIIRPTVIFGPEDILINNIAWLLRRFPVFAIPEAGDYRLQPVFVEDVAEIAVSVGQRAENMMVDAIGPETFTFEELVRLIATNIRSRARIIHLRPRLALFLSGLVGYMVRDIVLTKDELDGLMSNLLVSESPPVGQTRFSDWLSQNAGSIGIRYASELARHYR